MARNLFGAFKKVCLVTTTEVYAGNKKALCFRTGITTEVVNYRAKKIVVRSSVVTRLGGATYKTQQEWELILTFVQIGHENFINTCSFIKKKN